ncbi:MAG TPA: BON domain-containing protein [Casimicrobiaceae bacterium]|nr:BON domain-containing protein [Casimicrobiaceae bacterium]
MIRSTPMLAALLAALLAGPLLSACAPIIVAAGVGAGALIATDRRSTGAQLDDTTIETKLTTEAGTRWGDRIHLNVTSYNGNVLLSGEAPDSAIVDEIVALARRTDRVRTVYNEMLVAPTTDLSARTNDTYVTSKVKTRFIEANRFPATYVKVVTERKVVYLMGIVSRAEADAAAEIASTTSGVERVVRLFEITG